MRDRKIKVSEKEWKKMKAREFKYAHIEAKLEDMETDAVQTMLAWSSIRLKDLRNGTVIDMVGMKTKYYISADSTIRDIKNDMLSITFREGYEMEIELKTLGE